MPLFTVVIPVWNKRPHIRRAVESVLAQTCQNFELIAVNDHSSDGSEAEFAHFSDPRIRLLTSPGQKPQGPGSARNVGILAAQGEWVSFLDADDAWEPRYLEEMEALMGQFPQAGILACAYRQVDQGVARLSTFTQWTRHRGRQELDFQGYLKHYTQGRQPVWTSVTTVKRTVFHNSGLFPDGVVNGEDTDLWFRIVAETTLAWSPYLGATYFDNTVNKLTKFNLQNHYSLIPTLKTLISRPQHKALLPLLRKASNQSCLYNNLPRVKGGEPVGWEDFAEFYFAVSPLVSAQVFLLIILPNCWSRVLLLVRRGVRKWWSNLTTPRSEQGVV